MTNNAQAAVELSAMQYWKDTEGERVDDAQKLWAWYYNDRDKVHALITKAMGKIFKQKTIDRMNIRVFNIVARVVDKLCAVYKKPATRSLDGGQRFELGDGGKTIEINSADNKVYQELLTASTINKKAREWHKLGKIFNTVVVQPIWNAEKLSFDFTVHTPAWTVVIADDANYLKAKEFYYPIFRTNAQGTRERVLVYWSKTDYCYIDTLGNKTPYPEYPDGKNPYGILPVAVLRFKETNDFWGDGMWDLVDGNEEVCAQVTNIYYTALLQSHGQPVAIDMHLPGEPEIGPDKPLVVDRELGATSDPSFEFVQAQPLIQEVRDLIDWTLKILQSIKGLSPQQFSLESTVASGVSKIIDGTDISEIREDDVQVLEEFEYDLFNIMRTIYNFHTTGAKISDKAKFSIEFAEQKVQKTVDEKVKERQAGISGNWLSLIDAVMEDHPEMNKAQALEYLKQVEAEKKVFDTDFAITNAINDGFNSKEQTP